MVDGLADAVAAYENVWNTWPETIDAGNVKAVRDASIAVVLARISRPSITAAVAWISQTQLDGINEGRDGLVTASRTHQYNIALVRASAHPAA